MYENKCAWVPPNINSHIEVLLNIKAIIYMNVEMISVNNYCTSQIIWKIGKLQTKGYGCHT